MQGTEREPLPDIHIGQGDYLVASGRIYPLDTSAHAETAGTAILVAAERSHTDALDFVGGAA